MKDLLLWVKFKHIALRVAHIAGKDSVMADMLSRGVSNPYELA